MKLSDCGYLKIVYENDKYILAHIKCAIPKDIFTTDLHSLYKERRDGKLIMFGYPWMAIGKDLKHFKMKLDICKKELIDHENWILLNGKDRKKWLTTQKEFEDFTKPLYLEFINFIENLT
jgi:hypothetical protein